MGNTFCHIEEITLNKEQLLFIYNVIALKQKIVFLFHGLLENKLNALPIAYKLAKQGFFVVLMDTYGHGERENSFDKLGYYDFNNIFQDAYDTAGDINLVVEYLKNKYPELDYSNIICSGVSNGANCALIAGYLVKDVTHVVSIIGSLDWGSEILKSCYKSFKYFAKRPSKIKEDSIQNDITRYHPIEYYAKLDVLPQVLFLNGILDMTMPISSVKAAYKKLESVYRNKEQENKISLMTYDKNGHFVSAKMVNDFVEWLRETTL